MMILIYKVYDGGNIQFAFVMSPLNVLQKESALYNNIGSD